MAYNDGDKPKGATDGEALKQRLDLLERKTNYVRIPLDIDGEIVTITTSATADSVEQVPHHLRRPAQGYMVVRKVGKGDIYEDASTPAWTGDKVFLKCSGTSVKLTLLLF